MLGKLERDDAVVVKTIVEVWVAENAWSAETAVPFDLANQQLSDRPLTKRTYYTIAPEMMLKAQKYGRDRGLEIIGIYHSHIDHPAMPSEFDRVYAWPQYSYIIVSVENGKAVDLQNWSLDEAHHFQAEEMVATVMPL